MECIARLRNKISSIKNVPVEWEKVYAMAYIDEECGEVFYNYTEPRSDELFYYTSVIKKYNLLKSSFMDSVYELHDQFEELREVFIEEGLEPWTSCEFDFTSEGKLKVSFDYIDWINTEFDGFSRKIIICTKNLVFYQKRNMKWRRLNKSSNMLKNRKNKLS